MSVHVLLLVTHVAVVTKITSYSIGGIKALLALLDTMKTFFFGRIKAWESKEVVNINVLDKDLCFEASVVR